MPHKRFILAVNPHGGTKRSFGILERVKPVFESIGSEVDIRETRFSGHARQMIHTMGSSDYDGFCIIGGDGTLHEVVNGLLTREDDAEIPIGCIPGGTGNSFMQHVQCLDPLEAARKIISGETRPIDAVRITMRDKELYAFNIVGWGLVTGINMTAEKLRWLGDNRYTVATLFHVLKLPRRPAKLVIEAQEYDDEFIFAIGCNTQYTGKGMRLAPRARLDDGRIDLVVVRDASRDKLLKLFPKVFDGSHVSDPVVEYHQVKKFSVIPIKDEILTVDGELKGTTPFNVEVLPGAFRLFM